MATTQYTSSATMRLDTALALKNGLNVETLAGTHTMTARSATFSKLDPGGAARTVLLPATPPAYGPYTFENTADVAAETLTIKDSTNTTTILTLYPGEVATVVYDTEAAAFAVVSRLSKREAVLGAVTAAAGTATGDAGVLPAGTSAVYPVSGADDTKGVRLHADDAVTGRQIIIVNQVNNKVIKVYPPTGGAINYGVADAGFSSTSGRGVRLLCVDGATAAFVTV